MKLPLRPTRYIVIPKVEPLARAPAPSDTLGWMLGKAGGASTRGAVAKAAAAGPRRVAFKAATGAKNVAQIKVVNTSAADGALLVEPQGHMTLDRLKAMAPAGAKVVVEQWYSLERPIRTWAAQGAGTLRKPRTTPGRTITWTVTVVLVGASKRRLSDVLVTVYTNAAKGIGLEATTDGQGKVTFELSDRQKHLEIVRVTPLHSGWPVELSQVEVGPGRLEVHVPAIDLEMPDARNLAYGASEPDAGAKVRVAVVDTGVGPHPSLRLAGGENTTDAEPPKLLKDEVGHGTHVAGVIAAAADGLRRGEASAVGLHAFRVFVAGDPYASSFAIAAAITQAAEDGCDLINLSIGDTSSDEGIKQAVMSAWERGCVCVAAAGNDGRAPVDYPARYRQVLAISAIGLVGSWPEGVALDWTLSRTRGKALSGHPTFPASFTNRGARVALTAPGVAIVSTIHGGRWGMMSGTSMAAPVATGVLARRLAASPEIRDMPRDAARSAAIVKMVMEAAEELHLPAGVQGKGLAR